MILTHGLRPGGSARNFGEALRALFLSGGELPAGQGAAERLSPIAAAHRILTNAFGIIPFGAYLKGEDGARLPAEDAALERALRVRPNDRQTPFLLQKIVMSNAFWHGFGAVWNRRDGEGRLLERIPLPTECCSIAWDAGERMYWYTYDVDGVQRTFAPSELSFLFFETYNGVWGRGILDLARESIAGDALAQQYEAQFYLNGARLSGVVEVDTDASPETRERVRTAFAKFAGEDRFKVAVLDHGMKYTQLGLSQSEAQYLETRTFTVEEAARFTGIPKHMLQTGNEAYDSNAQQRVNWVTDTVVPFVTQWEQEERRKLLSRAQRGRKIYIHGNVSVLLRGDDMSRSQFYERMIRNSVYCPDDCRALEERPPIPGGLGKEFLITKNLGSLRSVLSEGQGTGEGGVTNGGI